jgi:hypothetical protein
MVACDTGNLPESPFTFNKLESNFPQGYLSYQSALQREYDVGVFSPVFLQLPTLNTISGVRQSNLVNQAKQRLSQKIKDSNVDIAVAYAERDRTFKMLAEMLTRLGRAYSAARHGRWGDALSALGVSPSSRNGSLRNRGNIARGWLEIQYGWRPLLSDIYGVVQTIQKHATHREYVVVKSGSKIYETSSKTVRNGDFMDSTDVSASFTVQARVKLRSTTMALRTATELGLTNPAVVAWELVPFSFVVDWAVPIGSFLSQIDASLGWQYVGGSYTTAYEQLGLVQRVSANPSGFVYHHCSVSGRNKNFSLQRVGIGSFADLLTLPYFKDPASMEHVLNALALLNSKR